MKKVFAIAALTVCSFTALADSIPDSYVTQENCNNLAYSNGYFNNVYKACGVGGMVWMKDFNDELSPKCHAKFGDDDMNAHAIKGVENAKFMTRPANLQSLCAPIRSNAKKILGNAAFEKIQTN